MSILTEQITPPTPDAARVATRVKQHIAQTWRQVLHSHQQGMRLVWENETITPAEIVTALGTDAAEVFALSSALATLIGGVDVAQVIGVPEGTTVTANPDGTVTLS